MFLCWNHLFQDCKRWLRLHGVSKSDEMCYYIDSVRSLLESLSLADFHTKLIIATKKWSKSFTNYFIDNIHNSIDRLGAWELRPYGLSTSTTNQSESFNFVVKKLQDWKDKNRRLPMWPKRRQRRHRQTSMVPTRTLSTTERHQDW